MPSASVTVLGAGDAFASRGRFQASYVIQSEAGRVLVDAGPTLLASMKRLNIAPADIDTVLVSHLHGDHFAGLAFLILEYMFETRLRRPLTIAGPRNLEARTWALLRAMYREADPASVARRLNFVVLEPYGRQRLGKLTVESIRTPHTVKDVSLALRIGTGGKCVVYSGDTGWTEELTELSAGADLFLCESTFFDSQFPFHLNYLQIAANRRRFKARRMVLTHLGREILDRLSEVKLKTATDGMQIAI